MGQTNERDKELKILRSKVNTAKDEPKRMPRSPSGGHRTEMASGSAFQYSTLATSLFLFSLFLFFYFIFIFLILVLFLLHLLFLLLLFIHSSCVSLSQTFPYSVPLNASSLLKLVSFYYFVLAFLNPSYTQMLFNTSLNIYIYWEEKNSTSLRSRRKILKILEKSKILDFFLLLWEIFLQSENPKFCGK